MVVGDFMNSGILIINKEKGMTSRDVVNTVCKKLHTKKVGHTGTLDPLATGVLVVCVNDATKIIDLITSDDKSYIAEVEVGTLTDTLDITGKVLKKEEQFSLDNTKLQKVLTSFVGSYMQEVPIYSAVRVNGKRLYEYARNEEEVELPKREVFIRDISLLEEYNCNSKTFKFLVNVSKGTYIRSLIRDIGCKLNIPMSMKNLERVVQGNFKIEDSIQLEEVSNNKIISIKDALIDMKKEIVTGSLKFKIQNGCPLDRKIDSDFIMFLDEDENILAIYKKEGSRIKSYRGFRRSDNFEKAK